MAWAPDEIEFGGPGLTVTAEDGTVLGTITLDDDGLTASSPVLQQIADQEVQRWGDPEAAYRWIARGNGYLVVTSDDDQ
jgi:hypothetical protein